MIINIPWMIIAYSIISIIVILGVIIWVYIWYNNKNVYKYKVRIFRSRENGRVKEVNWKGGYIHRKNSSPFFRIKTGMWFWNKIDLIETPKINFMDEEDRVYYKQIDVSSFIQLKRELVDDLVLFTPVESDVKYGAILSVQRVKQLTEVEPLWKKIAPMIVLGIIAVTFIVAYMFLIKSCPVAGA